MVGQEYAYRGLQAEHHAPDRGTQAHGMAELRMLLQVVERGYILIHPFPWHYQLRIIAMRELALFGHEV